MRALPVYMCRWATAGACRAKLRGPLGQVLHDYNTRLGEGVEDADRAAWLHNAKAVLATAAVSTTKAKAKGRPKGTTAEADDSSSRPPKLQRLGAHALLQALDQALLRGTGLGLHWYQQGPWQFSQPLLVIAADEGADNCAAFHFACHHLQLRCDSRRCRAATAQPAAVGSSSLQQAACVADSFVTCSGSWLPATRSNANSNWQWRAFMLHQLAQQQSNQQLAARATRPRLIVTRDVAHREWNDCKLSLQACQLWHRVLELTLVWNLGFGPWSNASWFQTMQAAAGDMANMLEPTDPLMQWLGEELQQESGGSAPLLSLEPFSTKGPRVSLSRWFSFFDATAHHLPWWHTKLACLVFAGVQLGTIVSAQDLAALMAALGQAVAEPSGMPAGNAAAASGLQAVAVPPAEPAGSIATGAVPSAMPAAAASASTPAVAKNPAAAACPQPASAQAPAVKHRGAGAARAGEDDESTARDSVRRLRDKCANSLHAAAVVLANEQARYDAHMMLAVMAPIRQHHGRHMQVLRLGREATVQLYADWALGGWVRPLQETLAVAKDPCKLAPCGFVVEETMEAHSLATQDSALTLQQNWLAARFDRLLHATLKHRAQSMVWHSEAAPGLFAGLLHQTAGCRAAALAKIKELWDVFSAAEGASTPAVKKAVLRSPFNTPVVREVCLALKAADFKSVHPYVADLLLDIFGGWGQSKVIEDAFQRLRDKETRGAPSNNIRAARRWYTLANGPLLAEYHRNPVGGPAVAGAKHVAAGCLAAPRLPSAAAAHGDAPDSEAASSSAVAFSTTAAPRKDAVPCVSAASSSCGGSSAAKSCRSSPPSAASRSRDGARRVDDGCSSSAPSSANSCGGSATGTSSGGGSAPGVASSCHGSAFSAAVLPASPAMPGSLRRDFFQASRQDNTGLGLREIAGKQTWPSPTPQGAFAFIAEWAVLRDFYRRNPDGPDWRCVNLAWRTGLLIEGEAYVDSAGQVWRCLGRPPGGSAALAWPMQKSGECAWTHGCPDPGRECHWLVLCHYDGLEALPCSPTSPLGFRACGGDSGATGVVLKQTGPPRPALVHAAELGFHGVGAAVLKALAKDLGVPYVAGSQAELLAALVAKVLKTDEAGALTVLEARAQRELGMNEAPVHVDAEALDAVLGAADKREYEEGHEKASSARRVAQELRHHVRVRRKNLEETAAKTTSGTSVPASSGCGGSAPSGSAASSSKGSALSRAQQPTPTEAGAYWRAPPSMAEWSDRDVQALMPRDAPVRVHRDAAQGRWQVFYKAGAGYSKSCSWKKWGGETNAVRQIAQAAWAFHEMVTHMPCTGASCPVQGLFA